ncbi:hypothetical protein DFAR_2530008 [Desulfarculales bacterium]
MYEATGQGLYALEKDFREEMITRFSWLTVAIAGGTVWVLISLMAAFGLVSRRRVQKACMVAMADGEYTGGLHLMHRRWPPRKRPRFGGGGLNNNGGQEAGAPRVKSKKHQREGGRPRPRTLAGCPSMGLFDEQQGMGLQKKTGGDEFRPDRKHKN